MGLTTPVQAGTYVQTLPVSNGTDDTATINARLAFVAAGTYVRGTPGQTYLLSGPIVTPNGGRCTVDMTGCRVVLLAGNQKNMLTNYANANPVAVGTGTVALGSNVVTTALAAQAVVGQTLTLTGAGAADGAGGTSYGPLIGNISAVNTGAGTVTLTKLQGTAANATAAVTGPGAAVGNLPAIGVATLYNRDKNVTIKGGRWDRGANGPNGTLTGYGANMIAHSIVMEHVDGLTIDIDRADSTAGVSFVWVTDVSNYSVSVHDCNVIRTAIQINGPAYDGVIPHCSGVHTDDLVSVGTNAYLYDTDTAGDVIGLRWGIVESKQLTSNGAAIRLLAGVGGRVDGVTGGSIQGFPFYAVLIGDATTGGHPETGGGTYGDIDLGFISAVSSSTLVRINAPACDRIKVRGVGAEALPVQVAAPANVGVLDVELDFITAAAPGQLVNLGGGTVGHLVLSKCGSPLQGVNSSVLVYLTGGTADTITLRDCWATLSNSLGSGYAVEIVTGTASRIRFGGGSYSGGAGLVLDHARSTPPALDIKLIGVSTTNMGRILNLSGGNANVHFGGVDCANNTSPAVYVSGATVSLDGSITLTGGNTTLVQRAASETVNTTSLRLPVDLAQITKTSGNMAYNSNAALSCGTGPVVCDGVSWRNLRTGELYPASGTLLTTGEETIPRLFVDFTVGQNAASGSLRGTQWVARKSGVVTQVRVRTVGAAAATPTLCRVGLYTVDNSNVHTLVASTPNDTTLFAAATTDYTKAFSASYTTVAGTRYAICILVVTAATMPTFPGRPFSSEYNTGPALVSRIDSQADLPSSFTPNVPSSSPLYSVLLP